jgi:hypothetical protein
MTIAGNRPWLHKTFPDGRSFRLAKVLGPEHEPRVSGVSVLFQKPLLLAHIAYNSILSLENNHPVVQNPLNSSGHSDTLWNKHNNWNTDILFMYNQSKHSETWSGNSQTPDSFHDLTSVSPSSHQFFQQLKPIGFLGKNQIGPQTCFEWDFDTCPTLHCFPHGITKDSQTPGKEKRLILAMWNRL